MCLQTRWKIPEIAEKDILTYKEIEMVLNEDNDGEINEIEYRSPFQNFYYIPGKVYKTDMVTSSDGSPYDTLAQNAMNNFPSCQLISIGPGFHSCLTRERLIKAQGPFGNLRLERFIFLCVIPKGSLYYKGLTDLIVSNQIKLIDIVD